jgi:hypothetical protein
VFLQKYSIPGAFSSTPIVTFAVEPFLASSLLRPNSDAAWPHSTFGTPLNLYYGWPNTTDDAAGINAIKASAKAIAKAATEDGQDLSNVLLYPNYALADASLESLYGPNVPVLKQLRKKYDPNG